MTSTKVEGPTAGCGEGERYNCVLAEESWKMGGVQTHGHAGSGWLLVRAYTVLLRV